jgi:LruC domain-containing protein
VSSYHGTFTATYRVTDAYSLNATATIVVTVAAPLIVDTDNDGAPDAVDEFPTDPYRAFNNRYPATGYSTLMYEDLWPYVGDYDFNDLVVDYKYNTITNASNNVVEVRYTFVAKCIGAALHNGFAFQLDNVAPNKISSVTGGKTNGAAWVNNASNGTENGQTFANVIVFNDAYAVMPFPGTNHFVNTYIDAPYVMPDTTSITVTFINNGTAPAGGTLAYSSFPVSSFNPYLICGDSGSWNQDRTK